MERTLEGRNAMAWTGLLDRGPALLRSYSARAAFMTSGLRKSGSNVFTSGLTSWERPTEMWSWRFSGMDMLQMVWTKREGERLSLTSDVWVVNDSTDTEFIQEIFVADPRELE